jgi:hypothetical protein
MKKIFVMFMVLLMAGFAFAGPRGPFPNKQFGQDLGKDGRSYNDLYLSDNIVFEGNTSDAYETTFDVTEATADRTITFPDSSGTVVLTATGATYSFEGATADDYETVLSVIDPTADNTIYFPDASGLAVLSSGVAPEAAKSFIGIDNGLKFEGATANDYEVSLDVADPTADVIYRLPAATAGTYGLMSTALATNAPNVDNSVTGGSNSLIFEGENENAFETIITPTDPTADRTITLPDASGSPVLSTGVPQALNSFWGASNSIVFEGATADEFEISLVPADAAADATVTVPAKTGTIALLTQTVTAKTQADTPVTVSAGDAGQIYDNTGAGGAVVFNIPEASTVIGKSFTFCVTAAQNLDVNPADGDTILGLTNAAGDAIRNATLGGSITLTVLDAANIVATAYQGTWTDVD